MFRKRLSRIFFNSTSAYACVLDNCFIRQHKLAKTLKCDRALTSESGCTMSMLGKAIFSLALLLHNSSNPFQYLD